MTSVHGPTPSRPYKLLRISRSKQADHSFHHEFSHNGKGGVQWTKALQGGEEFVDRPHEHTGIYKKEKLRFHFMSENGNYVYGKQMRIFHGETEKDNAELLHEISIMLRDTLKLDPEAESTFVEPLGMQKDDIYIIYLDDISVGTIQVLLVSGNSSLRRARIPGQPRDDTDGHRVVPVNNSLTNPGLSSAVAFPGHSGSHMVNHDATNGYPGGRQPVWLPATSPQVHCAFHEVPVASSSGLPTDNADLYTGNPSYSLLQPIGRGDLPPNPSVYYSHNGGAQGSPGYGNGGHEQPAYYKYTNAEFDRPDLASWPGNDQDADSTKGA